MEEQGLSGRRTSPSGFTVFVTIIEVFVEDGGDMAISSTVCLFCVEERIKKWEIQFFTMYFRHTGRDGEAEGGWGG